MRDDFTHPSDAKEGHRWTLKNGWEWRLIEVHKGFIFGNYKRKNEDGQWIIGLWDKFGESLICTDYDLIDAPREHTVWVFLDGSDFPHAKVNRPTTYDIENLQCKALKQITITEGEGL